MLDSDAAMPSAEAGYAVKKVRSRRAPDLDPDAGSDPAVNEGGSEQAADSIASTSRRGAVYNLKRMRTYDPDAEHDDAMLKDEPPAMSSRKNARKRHRDSAPVEQDAADESAESKDEPLGGPDAAADESAASEDEPSTGPDAVGIPESAYDVHDASEAAADPLASWGKLSGEAREIQEQMDAALARWSGDSSKSEAAGRFAEAFVEDVASDEPEPEVLGDEPADEADLAMGDEPADEADLAKGVEPADEASSIEGEADEQSTSADVSPEGDADGVSSHDPDPDADDIALPEDDVATSRFVDDLPVDNVRFRPPVLAANTAIAIELLAGGVAFVGDTGGNDDARLAFELLAARIGYVPPFAFTGRKSWRYEAARLVDYQIPAAFPRGRLAQQLLVARGAAPARAFERHRTRQERLHGRYSASLRTRPYDVAPIEAGE